MDRQEVLDKMSEFLKEAMMGRVSEVKPDDDLARDIGLDSMGAVEFISMVEDEFDISVTGEELSNIKTLNGAADLVLKKIETQ
jgi:acyl carrier protein